MTRVTISVSEIVTSAGIPSILISHESDRAWVCAILAISVRSAATSALLSMRFCSEAASRLVKRVFIDCNSLLFTSRTLVLWSRVFCIFSCPSRSSARSFTSSSLPPSARGLEVGGAISVEFERCRLDWCCFGARDTERSGGEEAERFGHAEFSDGGGEGFVREVGVAGSEFAGSGRTSGGGIGVGMLVEEFEMLEQARSENDGDEEQH